MIKGLRRRGCASLDSIKRDEKNQGPAWNSSVQGLFILCEESPRSSCHTRRAVVEIVFYEYI